MKTSISNDHCTATFNHKGAELISFTKNDREFIWDGNPQFWDKHSPVLFPIVGTLKNNQYQFKDQTYTLPRHGFARDMEFELLNKTDSSAAFSLKYSNETLKNYPFEFELQIIYTLDHDTLTVRYYVFNHAAESMYFSIGAHPAFALPNKFTNYSVDFEDEQALQCYLLENNLLSEKIEIIPLQDGELKLDYGLFEADALIFKNFGQKKLELIENSTPFLQIEFTDFPDLGIWTKPGAPFLCIEPWFGYSDTVDSSGKLEEKSGIQKLDAHSQFMAKYQIRIF